MIPPALHALFNRMPVLEPGHVWLTGAGPGDAGHLTLFALAGLAQADAVVHDALVGADVLALARPDAECIFAGKRGGKPSAQQADITARLVQLARGGRRVLRLKGGDPSVFGRSGEEALALAEQGVTFRVIPGISAGFAALTSAGIPATMRGVNQALVLATGHGANGDAEDGELNWAALARLDEPLVLYMALNRLPRIAAALIASGMAPDMPAAAIGSATMAEERVVVSTLSGLRDAVRNAGLVPPAVIVVGRIVALRARFAALIPFFQESLRWPRAE